MCHTLRIPSRGSTHSVWPGAALCLHCASCASITHPLPAKHSMTVTAPSLKCSFDWTQHRNHLISFHNLVCFNCVYYLTLFLSSPRIKILVSKVGVGTLSERQCLAQSSSIISDEFIQQRESVRCLRVTMEHTAWAPVQSQWHSCALICSRVLCKYPS